MADFDWHEFRTLAELCRTQGAAADAPGAAEALFRTAISRAYYSAFKDAYLLLLQERDPWIVYDHGVSTDNDDEKDEALTLLNLNPEQATNQFQKTVGSVHTFVAKRFKNAGTLARKNVGLDLFELKTDRQDADYNETVDVTKDWADDVIKKANKALHSIGQLRQANSKRK